MKKTMYTIALVLSLFATVWTVEARNIRMMIGAGERVEEASFPVERIHLQGEQFVGVDYSGQRIRLMPLDVGRATLTLYNAGGTGSEEWRIFVSERPPVTVEAVQDLLTDETGRPFESLFCSEIDGSGRIKISGLIREPRHIQRIQLAETVFEDSIVNVAEMDELFFDAIAKEIRQKANAPGISIIHAADKMFLRGVAFSQAEKDYVEAIARAIYPKIENYIKVRSGEVVDFNRERPLIQLECQILEISTDAARQVGIDWGGLVPLTATAGWTSEHGVGGPTGFISLNTEYLVRALIPQIESGAARVLYTQNLVCENGEIARFFAGGSFWIVAAVPGTGDVSAEEVEYGISMEFQPVADKFNNVGTKVNIEFSNMGEMVNSYPSLLKRYVRTSVNVKRGQTLSLGSLLGNDVRETSKKIPLLGDIPVLGELFKSKSYQEGKSEMVVLITPRVVVAGDPKNEALRKQIEDQMKK